ncbi:hypothetical protein IH992_23590 [Candidatus Poribacteria bacterium]|nr:hypothetical protein [Candidatus Poribacteria bacterium]
MKAHTHHEDTTFSPQSPKRNRKRYQRLLVLTLVLLATGVLFTLHLRLRHIKLSVITLSEEEKLITKNLAQQLYNQADRIKSLKQQLELAAGTKGQPNIDILQQKRVQEEETLAELNIKNFKTWHSITSGGSFPEEKFVFPRAIARHVWNEQVETYAQSTEPRGAAIKGGMAYPLSFEKANVIPGESPGSFSVIRFSK